MELERNQRLWSDNGLKSSCISPCLGLGNGLDSLTKKLPYRIFDYIFLIFFFFIFDGRFQYEIQTVKVTQDLEGFKMLGRFPIF